MTKYWKNPSPLVAILLPAVLFLAGCAIKPGPPCSKGGMVYGRTVGIFQGGWDDYYERALSYMEGECYDAALCDLDAAIAQKGADRRMARTFGMHFVDYFPHREKGLVFYLTGNDEAALEELELSIEQEKSDKALFYRDKVRERIMRKKGVEASLPRVVITSPRMLPGDGQTAWTADESVIVAGVAEDEQYVSEISMAGTPIFMDGSLRSAEFSEKLRLPQGRHEIEIVATNLLGRQGKEKFVLIVDRAGPALVVEQLVPGVATAGYARDNAGVASVSLDGNSKPSSGEETVRPAGRKDGRSSRADVCGKTNGRKDRHLGHCEKRGGKGGKRQARFHQRGGRHRFAAPGGRLRTLRGRRDRTLSARRQAGRRRKGPLQDRFRKRESGVGG